MIETEERPLEHAGDRACIHCEEPLPGPTDLCSRCLLRSPGKGLRPEPCYAWYKTPLRKPPPLALAFTVVLMGALFFWSSVTGHPKALWLQFLSIPALWLGRADPRDMVSVLILGFVSTLLVFIANSFLWSISLFAILSAGDLPILVIGMFLVMTMIVPIVTIAYILTRLTHVRANGGKIFWIDMVGWNALLVFFILVVFDIGGASPL